VKRLWVKPLAGSRYPLAMLAGLLLAAAFPKCGIAGLAWLGPGLMLAAALGKRGGEAFRIGYVAGLTHYLASLYWLVLIPYRWHGVPLGPAAGWLALSGVLALFPATWVWVLTTVQSARTLAPRGRCRVGEEAFHGVPFFGPNKPKDAVQIGRRDACPTTFSGVPSGEWPEAASSGEGLRAEEGLGTGNLLPRRWTGRTVWALCGAAVWVALEMLMARFLGGFPWDLLGDSQYQLVPLIQVASVTGVYGVSFLMVWCSLSLLSAGITVIRRPAPRSLWVAEIWLPTMVVALGFSFGFRQIRQSPPPGRTLKVTLVQPSIPQTLIWDSKKNAERFGDMLRLCEQALTNRTDLLIWPESAIPELLRYDEATALAVLGLARRHRVWMIVGADDFEAHPKATRPGEGDFYNCSFLISPAGKLVQPWYRKRSLVIFGEYIPCTRWLPFVKWFTPIQGGFTPGSQAVQFELNDLGARASPLICFEDVFPQLGRGAVAAGTDFLVNLTNDGWFGQSAAQWQHATTALFRAVENGVPLIRCTNNGLTCWIDAQGRLRQIFRDPTGSVYGPGFSTLEIPLPAAGQEHRPTFYNRHGDWFGWACSGVGGLVLAWAIYVSRRRKPLSA